MFDELEKLLLENEHNFSKTYDYCKEMRSLGIESKLITDFVYKIYDENKDFFDEVEERYYFFCDIADVLTGFCSPKISLR